MLNRPERRQRQRFVAIVVCAAAAIAVPLSVAAQIPVFGVDAVNLSQPVPRMVQEPVSYTHLTLPTNREV